MKYAVLVCVVGCASPSSIPPDTAHSGSRLKLAWYEFADGVRTWASPTDLFDAELQLPCTPTEWADGVTRCTPSYVPPLFLDADCTQPAVDGGSSQALVIDAAPACALMYSTIQHGQRPTGPIYVRSGQTMTVSAIYVRSSDGSCSKVPPDPRFPQQQYTVGTIGRTMQPSELVTTTTAYQGTGDMVVQTLQSADGLLVPLHLFDSVHGVGCELIGLAGASAGPCFALDTPVANIYTDSTCAQPALQVPAGCDPPAWAWMYWDQCGRYFEVADHAAGGTLYDGEFGSCGPTQQGSDQAYPLGAAFDAATVTRAPEPSNQREQLVYASAGDVRVRDPRIFDTQLGTECTLDAVGDGLPSVCHPASVASVGTALYSDSNCTQALPPLAVMPISEGCLTRPTPTIAVDGDRVFKIGPPHMDNVYASSGPNICTWALDATFELGEEIPTTFPVATKRRDL